MSLFTLRCVRLFTLTVYFVVNVFCLFVVTIAFAIIIIIVIMDPKYEIQAYQEAEFLDFIFRNLDHINRNVKAVKLDLFEINDRFFDFRKAILRTIPNTKFTPTTIPLNEQHNILVTNNTGKHRSSKATTLSKRRSSSSILNGNIKRALYQPKVNVRETIKMFLLKFEPGSRIQAGELIAPDLMDNLYIRYMLVFSQELSIRSRPNSTVERLADLNNLVHVPVNKSPLFGNSGNYDTYVLVVLIPENASNWRIFEEMILSNWEESFVVADDENKEEGESKPKLDEMVPIETNELVDLLSIHQV